MTRISWVALLVLTSCQTHSREISFEITFELPDGKAIDDAKLHVRGRQRCTRDEYKSDQTAPEPPAPGLEDWEETPMGRVNVQKGTDRPRWESWFHGDRCEVALTAWYDTNDDRAVNAGDFVASSPRQEFKSLASQFGKLVLKPVSP